MARPDLTHERREQILDAFARCAARRGLAATSLEDVAREAGMRRPILRHYVGNRDALVAALLARLLARWRRDLEELAAFVAACPTVERLVDALYWQAGEGEGDVPLAEALAAAARHDAALAAWLAGWLKEEEAAIAALLAKVAPAASTERLAAAAHGIVAIHNDYLAGLALGLPAARRALARAATATLAAGLAGEA